MPLRGCFLGSFNPRIRFLTPVKSVTRAVADAHAPYSHWAFFPHCRVLLYSGHCRPQASVLCEHFSCKTFSPTRQVHSLGPKDTSQACSEVRPPARQTSLPLPETPHSTLQHRATEVFRSVSPGGAPAFWLQPASALLGDVLSPTT